MIVKKQDGSRVGKHRWNIRGHKTFALDGADDQWIAFAHSDDLLGIISRHAGKREQAFQLRQRFDYGVFEISVEVLLNKVGDDFSIGFGCELVPFFRELSLQRKVVLDDAVVCDNDASLAVTMRMGVLLRR